MGSRPRDRISHDTTAAQRILLLGSSGRLGSALKAEWGRRAQQQGESDAVHLVAPTRTDLATEGIDLATGGLASHTFWARRFEQWQPDVVINCIAMSDVDPCEREAAAARAANRDLPEALARAARACNAQLIHFSTDFVFDGALRRPYRESDAAHPLSIYASTKLEGERAIEAAGGSWWIFRVSWLYGGASRNLAATLLDTANAGRVVPLADDRFGVPNPVQWVAREIVDAVRRLSRPGPDRPENGLYHLSCRGTTTWYEFGREFIAQAIAAGRIAAQDAPRVEAFNEKARNRPARRPEWSVLDSTRYEYVFTRKTPHWRDAIPLALR